MQQIYWYPVHFDVMSSLSTHRMCSPAQLEGVSLPELTGVASLGATNSGFLLTYVHSFIWKHQEW